MVIQGSAQKCIQNFETTQAIHLSVCFQFQFLLVGSPTWQKF